jgi:hypothetical protein
MGYLCSDGDGNSEAQEEEVNETTETDPTQSMPILRCNHDQEAIQRGTGGLDCLPAEKVLQPGLHGEVDGRPNQESYSAKQSETINKEAQAILRTLRHHKEAAGCSSSGRKSPEQFGYEFADAMRLLPSAITFAKLHRHGGASENLFTLLSPDDAQRLMRDTPITDAEAWRSLTEESKTGLVLGFAEGRFVISDEGPLASGAAARVLRLRGYGDSIVAPLAGAFIKAYLEARRRF